MVINTKFKVFAVLCLCVLTSMVGCRLINPNSDSTESLTTHMLKGQILRSDIPGNMRAKADPAAPANLAKGVYVWVEQLGRTSGQTCPEGRYLFINIAPGEYNIVAEFEKPDGSILRVRSGARAATLPQDDSPTEDLIIVPANKRVKGMLSDENGKPLPVGTVLSLWGEEFRVGPEAGQFTTPNLPHDVTAVDLIVIGLPRRPKAHFTLPETSPEANEIDDTVVDLGLPGPDALEPISARISFTKNTIPIASLLKDLRVNDRIDMVVEPVNLNTGDAGFKVEWFRTEGEFDPKEPGTTLTALSWIAPEDVGLATISVKVSATGRGFYKIDVPAMVETRSSEKSISAFSFASLNPAVIGTIVEQNIELKVPFDTDVTALVPTIEHSGQSIAPAAMTPTNFSKPVNYTLTAEDLTTKTYVITVTITPKPEAAPLSATITPSAGTEVGDTKLTVSGLASGNALWLNPIKDADANTPAENTDRDSDTYSLDISTTADYTFAVGAYDVVEVDNSDRVVGFGTVTIAAEHIEPGASIADVSINGLKGNLLTTADLVITLEHATFTAIAVGSDAAGWVKNLPAGLTAVVKTDVTAGDSSLVISISGTPGVTAEAVLELEIPGNVLVESEQDLAVTTNPEAKIHIIEVTASLDDIAIVGLKTVEMDTQIITITLANDSFESIGQGTDLSGWLVLPAGLSAKANEAVAAGDKTLKIEIAGIPLAALNDLISVDIPAEVLQASSINVVTTANENAKFEVVAFAGGAGTEAAPYQISTWYHLNNVRDDLDKHFILINDLNNTTAGYAEHVGSVGASNEGWAPLGISGASFTGSFNGDNKTIANLYINRLGEEYVGLFGYSNGQIKNLTMSEVNINGLAYVGALAGRGYGDITNCHVTSGSVSVTGAYVGGLIGDAQGNTVDGCSVAATITGIGVYTGGLIGWVRTDGCTIISCNTTGSVTGGGRYVGGLVGQSSNSTITDCYSESNVTGEGDYVGGLVGLAKINSSIENSHHKTGNVTGEGKWVGGLVGNSSSTSITSCYSESNVTGVNKVGGLVGYFSNSTITGSHATGSVTGGAQVGGLVGYFSNSSITGSYATGSVTGGGEGEDAYVGGLIGKAENVSTISSCYSESTVTGEGHCIGGLVGYLYNNGTITGSYATGSVTGDSDVGGLAGLLSQDSAITRCYATGSITGNRSVGGLAGYSQFDSTIANSYATGSVTGNSSVGGLVGYLHTTTVDNCYSIGYITVNGSGPSGGLIGDSNGGTVSSSYWDITTSGLDTSAGGTGKDSTAMKLEATFVDWNFTHTWGINESSSYPWLQQNKQDPVPAP